MSLLDFYFSPIGRVGRWDYFIRYYPLIVLVTIFPILSIILTVVFYITI